MVTYTIKRYYSGKGEPAVETVTRKRIDSARHMFLEQVWEALDAYGARDTAKAHSVMNDAVCRMDCLDAKSCQYLQFTQHCMGDMRVTFTIDRES